VGYNNAIVFAVGSPILDGIDDADIDDDVPLVVVERFSTVVIVLLSLLLLLLRASDDGFDIVVVLLGCSFLSCLFLSLEIIIGDFVGALVAVVATVVAAATVAVVSGLSSLSRSCISLRPDTVVAFVLTLRSSSLLFLLLLSLETTINGESKMIDDSSLLGPPSKASKAGIDNRIQDTTASTNTNTTKNRNLELLKSDMMLLLLLLLLLCFLCLCNVFHDYKETNNNDSLRRFLQLLMFSVTVVFYLKC
jgi:hypothetical protein